MKISLIAAMASNRIIGDNNQLPWHLSADLERFKNITLGSPVLMGRKTFQSIGKPLPGRSNIIISRNFKFNQTDCLVFNELEKALEHCRHNAKEIFVIGGVSLYQSTLPIANTLYLTQINQDFSGDTFFPDVDMNNWTETEREDVQDDPGVNFSYSFLKFESRLVSSKADDSGKNSQIPAKNS